jgi:hypothetical protein
MWAGNCDVIRQNGLRYRALTPSGDMRISCTDLMVADQSHSAQGRVHFINAIEGPVRTYATLAFIGGQQYREGRESYITQGWLAVFPLEVSPEGSRVASRQ